MTATLTYTLGKFVWREHFTRDVAGAKRFYGSLFGWTAEDRPMGPDWSYTILKNGTQEIGGMMDIANMPGEGAGIPAHWGVYVSVADVDAAAEKAVALGGKLVSPCMDIPNVGRFAAVQDPQGAHINLFRSSNGDPAQDTPMAHIFCWESLNTTDVDAAVPFYEAVVGWTTDKMGDMTLFQRDRPGQDEQWVASTGPAVGAPPHWLTFVAVENVEAKAAQAKDLGGQVLVPATPIPDTGTFAIIQDPAGAVIGLFQS